MPRSASKKIQSFVPLILLALLGAVVITTAYILNRVNLAARKSQAFDRPYVRWFHPNYHYNFNHDINSEAWAKNFTDPAFERDVLPNIDVMGLFIFQVNKNPDNFLATLIPQLKRNNVKLAIEGMALPHVESDGKGGLRFLRCDDPAYLDKQIASELAMLKKIYDLGGEVEYLGLDDPLGRGLKNSHYHDVVRGCNGTAAESIDKTLKYIQAVQKEYPNIKIGLITNFPNWPYGDTPSYSLGNFGNYKFIFDSFMQQAKARNITISFVNVDNPYDYALGIVDGPNRERIQQTDWTQRLLDLEKQVKGHGLKFGLIYNSRRGGRATDSDKLSHDDTLAFVRHYHQHGGRPDHLIVEYWFERPLAMMPADKDYTSANTALAAFNLYDALIGVNKDENQPAVRSGKNSSPVYLLSDSRGITLMTISNDEANSAQKNNGYTFRKSVFNAWISSQNQSMKPVYRLRHDTNGYLYTLDEKEKDDAVATYGYVYEGIAFWAYPNSQENTEPVHRLSRTAGNGSVFLYTTNEGEKNRALQDGYTLNGTAFWVAQ